MAFVIDALRNMRALVRLAGRVVEQRAVAVDDHGRDAVHGAFGDCAVEQRLDRRAVE